MQRKDLQHIKLTAPALGKRQKEGKNNTYKTPEEINLQPSYSKEDIKDLKHLNFAAGIPPYLRGPYSTMYVSRPWTIRQYAGFSVEILLLAKKDFQ